MVLTRSGMLRWVIGFRSLAPLPSPGLASSSTPAASIQWRFLLVLLLVLFLLLILVRRLLILLGLVLVLILRLRSGGVVTAAGGGGATRTCPARSTRLNARARIPVTGLVSVAVEVGGGFGVIGDHGIEIEGLRVGEIGVRDGDGDGGPVGAEPAAKALAVVAGAEFVVPGFGVAFLTLEFVILQAGIGVGMFAAVGIEIGVVADGAVVRGNDSGARRASDSKLHTNIRGRGRDMVPPVFFSPRTVRVVTGERVGNVFLNRPPVDW
jgi:hypothetical protein